MRKRRRQQQRLQRRRDAADAAGVERIAVRTVRTAVDEWQLRPDWRRTVRGDVAAEGELVGLVVGVAVRCRGDGPGDEPRGGGGEETMRTTSAPGYLYPVLPMIAVVVAAAVAVVLVVVAVVACVDLPLMGSCCLVIADPAGMTRSGLRSRSRILVDVLFCGKISRFFINFNPFLIFDEIY